MEGAGPTEIRCLPGVAPPSSPPCKWWAVSEADHTPTHPVNTTARKMDATVRRCLYSTPRITTMNNDRKPSPSGINASDQDKANTPDKHRNDKAQWKDHDMPDAEHNARPEDYERVPVKRP